MSDIKITIIGAGFVGMSIATLLSTNHKVLVHDIDESKVKKINLRKSTIYDRDIDKAFKNQDLDLCATSNVKDALTDANIIFIATPTSYNDSLNIFNTEPVESAICDSLKFSNAQSLIVIKSTVPIGFTKSQSLKYDTDRITFSPEFLREGSALYDNLYPSRLIIGGKKNKANEFLAQIMSDAAIKKKFEILFMSATEAEATKLFSNTYLAMRVAFFNELDSFAMQKKINPLKVIKGISLDPRIGDYYNNPSFGYGGYCLPKDTKQLLSHYDEVPQSLIEAIINSNVNRKLFLINKIKSAKPKKIGIFRLIMKEGSENFRESAVLSLINELQKSNFKITLYEPTINEDFYKKIPLNNDLKNFIDTSDMILANRLSSELKKYKKKVFTRDIFQTDL